MIFTDLLFLLAFLPIALVAMVAIGENREKNAVCVGLSLVMLLWTRPVYILLAALPLILTYFAARMIQKDRSKAAYISANVISSGILLGLAVAVGRDDSLSGGLTAAALLLMAYKLYGYLTDVMNGEPAEKSFFSLCVYFISFEFIFFNPALKYSSVREGINNRSAKLSGMAVGMGSFIVGLAEASVLGLSLDRLRLAAFYTDSLPWGDALWGSIFTAIEAYVLLDGYMRMSSGLASINGIQLYADSIGFVPRLDITKHLHGVYPTLAERVKSDFDGRASLFGLIAASITAGVCLAFDVGEGAFAGLLLAGLIIANLRGSGLFEKIFAIILTAMGFLLMAVGDITKLFGMFGYGFDMSFEFFDELKRVIPWVIISAFCITPMPRILASMWRERMAQSIGAYSAMRILSTAGKVLLLLVSLLAVVAYR